MYNEFILNEKELSNEFLINQQILDKRFDENEYLVIKKIFTQEKIIKKIYKVIDCLVIQEKLEFKSRFLIIGDFLFSITSFDFIDPANIVFKISRNDYIKNIFIRSEINTLFDYNYQKYIKIHKKLLIGLRIEGVLDRTIIKTKKEDWETSIYIKLNIEKINLEKINPLGISKFPFSISSNNKYCIGSFRNIWKLKRKRKEMEDFPISKESIVRANSIRFKFDKKTFEIVRKKIEKEKIKILKKIKCVSIENYFIKLKKITEDKKYSKKLIQENKEIMELHKHISTEYIELLKYFQKILCISILDRNILGKNFYLPCFIDNRGRQYYGTLLSPTFYMIFRYLYSFSKKKKIENLKESTFYNKIIKYKHLVEKFNLEEKECYLLLVLLIELGKFFIEEKNYIIKTEEIIKLGIENIDINNKDIKFEDSLYIEKIKENIIALIKKEKIDENIIIFKDATASGLQNYGILLGYREEKLEYLNLNGENWCDTYKYIIDKFLNVDEKLLKRKYWKSTIMTVPYNAVWFTCFNKFIENLEKDNISYREMNDEDKNKIKNIHKKFYINIKKNIKEEFFVKEEGDLIEFKYNEWKIVNIKNYKINFNKERDKYTDILYMILEDKEKTKTAIEANNMHYLDAQLVKEILKKIEIITIHDCFGVRLSELHILLDEINRYYSKIIGKNTYCIFIVK